MYNVFISYNIQYNYEYEKHFSSLSHFPLLLSQVMFMFVMNTKVKVFGFILVGV